MNLVKKFIVLFICLSSVSGNGLIAQENSKRKHQFPISIMASNHSWAFPFQKILRIAPIYPGLSAETEVYYRYKPAFKLYQTAQLGGFINPSSGSGIYLNSNFGMRYSFQFGLFADLSLGLGFLKSYYTIETYNQNEAGEYEKTAVTGVGALSSNITIGAGYDFSKKQDTDIRLFLKYQWIGSSAYWSLITIRPNGLLHVGIQFNPFHKKQS